MGSRPSRSMILELDSDELGVFQAAIRSCLEETASCGQSQGQDRVYLRALSDRTAALKGCGPFRLKLGRDEAMLAQRHITMVIARSGYFVGRPQAINALTRIHQKLERLLKTGRMAGLRSAAGRLFRR